MHITKSTLAATLLIASSASSVATAATTPNNENFQWTVSSSSSTVDDVQIEEGKRSSALDALTYTPDDCGFSNNVPCLNTRYQHFNINEENNSMLTCSTPANAAAAAISTKGAPSSEALAGLNAATKFWKRISLKAAPNCVAGRRLHIDELTMNLEFDSSLNDFAVSVCCIRYMICWFCYGLCF